MAWIVQTPNEKHRSQGCGVFFTRPTKASRAEKTIQFDLRRLAVATSATMPASTKDQVSGSGTAATTVVSTVNSAVVVRIKEKAESLALANKLLLTQNCTFLRPAPYTTGTAVDAQFKGPIS